MATYWYDQKDGLDYRRDVSRAWRWQRNNPYCLVCDVYGHEGCLPSRYTGVGKFLPSKAPKYKKRRTRKKHDTGEYQVQGFPIRFEVKDKTSSFIDSFWDEWIEFISDYGLIFGGGGHWGMVEGKGFLHDGHRRLVEDLLKRADAVTAYVIGPIVDVQYGSYEEFDQISTMELIKKNAT